MIREFIEGVRTELRASRRRRAMKEIEVVFQCWYIINRRLHEDRDPGIPSAYWENRFDDVVRFHQMMVR